MQNPNVIDDINEKDGELLANHSLLSSSSEEVK